MTLVRRVARPMLAAMFVAGGLDQLKHPGAQGRHGSAAHREVRARPSACPTTPSCWCAPTGPRWSAAGSLLALGRLPRLASTVLAATLVPTTVAAHSFWQEQDPEVRAQQQVQFLKNLGLLGGLLLAAVDTEGRPGLAYRAHMVERQRPPAAAARPAARRGTLAARRRPRGQAEGGPGAACHRLTGRRPPPPGRSTRRVVLPGSKSLTNRYLVLAALASDVVPAALPAAVARHPAHGAGAAHPGRRCDRATSTTVTGS